MAAKSKDPGSLFSAIHTLVLAYRSVRNFDKARELLEKGIAVVKDLPPNTDSRVSWEGNLYMHLGSDLVRSREYEKLSMCFLYRFTSSKTTWLLFGEILSS